MRNKKQIGTHSSKGKMILFKTNRKSLMNPKY